MAKTKAKKLTGRKRDERIAAYFFVAPAVILLIAFLVVPMIYTVYFSGFKYQIMRPDAMKFIGIENYIELFQDKNFWQALKNTVYFTVIVVPVQCALALGLPVFALPPTGDGSSTMLPIMGGLLGLSAVLIIVADVT